MSKIKMSSKAINQMKMANEVNLIDNCVNRDIKELDLVGSGKYWVGKDYSNFIYKDFAQVDIPFVDLINRHEIPRMPWHDIGCVVFGHPARDTARHFIERWNFSVIQKNKNDEEYHLLLPKTYINLETPQEVKEKAFNCEIQICRSSSIWSTGIKETEDSIQQAYKYIISNAKHYIYIENQFFVTIYNNDIVKNKICEYLYERIAKAIKNEETFRLYICTPLLPGFEGEIGGEGGASIQTIIYWNNHSMANDENSLIGRLSKITENPFKYISFCALRTHSKLEGKLVSELIYIHSKLLIVDDEWALIASANINDRSMLGSRDSEMASVFHDTQFNEGKMNGKSSKSGLFAGSLRRRIFREHLTVLDKNSSIDFTDPISDKFFSLWNDTAEKNTQIYEEVFCCIPTDKASDFEELSRYKKQIPLAEADPKLALQKLDGVMGHLVKMPLNFLCKQANMLPQTLSKEGMAPASCFV